MAYANNWEGLDTLSSTALIQRRHNLLSQMTDALKQSGQARAKGDETRAAELEADYEKMAKDEEIYDRHIRNKMQLEAAERRAAADHLEELEKTGMSDKSKKDDYAVCFRQWMVNPAELTPEQRAILKGGYRTETRAQSTSTTAGGYLIAPDYMVELEKSIKDFSGIMQVARIVNTATGANLPWPTLDATARKATIVAENATSTPTDFTFGQKSLDAYMYRDMAAASLELVQDSEFDIDRFIGESFGESFGRGLNYDFTLGTGSGQPNGIVTASTLGTTAASATTFTRTELVDHLHKVDPGYRRSKKCGWMFHDLVLAAIKKLALGASDATPLWQASMRDGEPDKIEGYPYWINQDMSSTFTTGQKLILFGDFSKYIVRQVLGMTLKRLEERFIDSGQIGYIAFARYDGELINTAAVKHLKLA